MRPLHHIRWRAFSRWWAVGLAFYLSGLCILYVLIGVLKAPLLLGTLLMAEATTLLRYAINDRWVFEQPGLSWKRLWQFHIANAAGFLVWWILTNVLPRLGVHYLIASTVGTGSSMLWSVATNFLWVWRKRDAGVSPGRAPFSTHPLNETDQRCKA